MNELMQIFGQPAGQQSFDQIRIAIASPESLGLNVDLKQRDI